MLGYFSIAYYCNEESNYSSTANYILESSVRQTKAAFDRNVNEWRHEHTHIQLSDHTTLLILIPVTLQKAYTFLRVGDFFQHFFLFIWKCHLENYITHLTLLTRGESAMRYRVLLRQK